MNLKSIKLRLFIYSALLLLIFPNQARAYLDPGTGSYLFQILIAGLLGSLFFIKSIIKKLKQFFKNLSVKKPVTEQVMKIDENK
jgi:hypothetical protein